MDSCRSRADFAALRRGRRFDSELLWMTFAADRGLSGPRVAFALSRHRGTAVQRNRVRRRLRAVFCELAIDLAPGRYLVGVRAAASAVTYQRARAELMRLLLAAEALSDRGNQRL
ncbi:ribonuclease P protein component [Candidatus Poriferisodalis sp.]|uniref:ribonuclease P protein component n=1 Tax=Candidatus Poriferisodalis sp. TaxID=3101277 RepID=UPI003B593BAB